MGPLGLERFLDRRSAGKRKSLRGLRRGGVHEALHRIAPEFAKNGKLIGCFCAFPAHPHS